MALAGVPPDSSNFKDVEIGHMSFNRDGSYLSVGTSEAWMHIACTASDRPQQISSGKAPGVRLIARLGRSCLVALVTYANPRKLVIINSAKNEAICCYSYQDTVLSVRLNQLRMVVCLAHKIYVHVLESLKVIHTIDISSSPNPKGIMSLTHDDVSPLLAFPSSDTRGEVHIFDVGKLERKRIILVAEGPISFVEFNGTGTLLAIASGDGTQIFVYNTNGTRLHQFHRGLISAEIYSMSFSQNEAFLAVTSSNPTVHIFRLHDLDDASSTSNSKLGANSPPSPSPPRSHALGGDGATTSEGESWTDWNSWMDWAKTTVATVIPMLPAIPLPEMLTFNRAFSTFTAPSKGYRNLVNLSTTYTEDGPESRVLVASYDGFLYIYRLNAREEGECELIKQVNLLRIEDHDKDD